MPPGVLKVLAARMIVSKFRSEGIQKIKSCISLGMAINVNNFVIFFSSSLLYKKTDKL